MDDSSSNPLFFTPSEIMQQALSPTYPNPLNLIAEMAKQNVDKNVHDSSSSTPAKNNPITLPDFTLESLIRKVICQIATINISSLMECFVESMPVDVLKYIDTSSSSHPLEINPQKTTEIPTELASNIRERPSDKPAENHDVEMEKDDSTDSEGMGEKLKIVRMRKEQCVPKRDRW